MADIAASGYSALQTSPANDCYVGEGGGMDLYGNGKWYFHYHPTDWTIGNYQLGSRDELKAMCAEAEKYGIKVIVDVVPNHTTPNGGVKQNLLNANSTGSLYHANGFNEITNYEDRYQCTTGQMGGLFDVDTEDPVFQDYFIKYLNDCIDCGVDGFRYDTAKHIALPNESVLDSTPASKGYTNNFWPRVTKEITNAISIFNYGEVLQSGSTPFKDYVDIIGSATASWYGGDIRNCIRGNYFDINKLKDMNCQGADKSKVVTWVESHDNYINDGTNEGNSQNGLSNAQVIMAWAVITARQYGTPLFFDRPANCNAGNMWGNNKIGATGDDMYKDPQVVAVNKFRNAMVGEAETLRNPDGNNKLLQIDRGTKGCVFVNLGGETSINSQTTMADGTYTDQVSGSTFTVSNGTISGKIQNYKVAVIYSPDSTSTSSRAKVSSSVASGSFTTDTLSVKLTATNATSSTYSIDGGKEISYTDGDTITLGKDAKYGAKITLTLKAKNEEGEETTVTYTYTKVDPNAVVAAYLKVPSDWSGTMHCYIYDAGKTGVENAAWPGVEMTKVSDGLYIAKVPDGYTNASVIFSCTGGARYPEDQKPGLAISNSSMVYSGGQIWEAYVSDEGQGDDDNTEEELSLGSISISHSNECTVGDKVTIKVNNIKGGTEPYTYKIAANDEEIGSTASTTWTPDSDGSYKIDVTVTDAKGKEVTKSTNYTVNPKESSDGDDGDDDNKTLKATLSTNLASPQQAGKTINLIVDVTDESGDVEINYYAENKSTGDVEKIQNGKWTPTKAGTYYLYAEVEDSNNFVTTNTITYKISTSTSSEDSSSSGDKTESGDAHKALPLIAALAFTGYILKKRK